MIIPSVDVTASGIMSTSTASIQCCCFLRADFISSRHSRVTMRDRNGKVIRVTHPDSWQGGVNGARPGFIMLAHPHAGADYFQEHAPGVALDTAQVIAPSLWTPTRTTKNPA